MHARSENGQLLLPILAVMFLFGLFWVTYVYWCGIVYWKMRMDLAADATALSAAREEAAMLNTIGTFQYLENGFMQKVGVLGKDLAEVQISGADKFDEYNRSLVATVELYRTNVMTVANTIAAANGADEPPIPIPAPQHHLKAQGVTIHYFNGVVPAGPAARYYKAAYYARDWWPRKTAPQPIQRTTWRVGHSGIWRKGKAQLWLDVDPGNPLDNGGFPSEEPSFWRGLGVQCNFPQFNARMMPKN